MAAQTRNRQTLLGWGVRHYAYRRICTARTDRSRQEKDVRALLRGVIWINHRAATRTRRGSWRGRRGSQERHLTGCQGIPRLIRRSGYKAGMTRTMSEKAKNCEECRHFLSGGILCVEGHNPRFYKPKHERDGDWGWKRRCEDFEKLKGDEWLNQGTTK